MVDELDDRIHAQITALCAEGDELAEADRPREAIERYERAWAMLPEPRLQREAASWILTAIGDTRYLVGQTKIAFDALNAAVRAPGGLGNPLIHLRLGQCAFDLGLQDRAADELMRAYMGAGPEIFADEDPRYIEFLASRAKGIELPR